MFMLLINDKENFVQNFISFWVLSEELKTETQKSTILLCLLSGLLSVFQLKYCSLYHAPRTCYMLCPTYLP